MDLCSRQMVTGTNRVYELTIAKNLLKVCVAITWNILIKPDYNTAHATTTGEMYCGWLMRYILILWICLVCFGDADSRHFLFSHLDPSFLVNNNVIQIVLMQTLYFHIMKQISVTLITHRCDINTLWIEQDVRHLATTIWMHFHIGRDCVVYLYWSRLHPWYSSVPTKLP